MIYNEIKHGKRMGENDMWIIMAILSAFFAGLTTILAKCGIKHTDADIATAVRTIVVLAFSWLMVLIVGSADTITELETKSILFSEDTVKEKSLENTFDISIVLLIEL